MKLYKREIVTDPLTLEPNIRLTVDIPIEDMSEARFHLGENKSNELLTDMFIKLIKENNESIRN